jgi:hypothetical protein
LEFFKDWLPRVENSTTNATEPVLAATVGAGFQAFEYAGVT